MLARHAPNDRVLVPIPYLHGLSPTLTFGITPLVSLSDIDLEEEMI